MSLGDRPDAIILAAGKGTRMKSDLPKVLHPVAGQPMVTWVVRACRQAGVGRCVLVVGYQGDRVREALANEPDCRFVEQAEQLGTAHAVRMAEPLFVDRPETDVFVLAGDGPLIRARTLNRLLQAHRRRGAAATLATSVIPDPTGYGRIIRDAGGRFERIVEHKDADQVQRAICEVNPSYYCFRSGPLFAALRRVGNRNAKGEYYLTDVLELLRQDGRLVEVVDAVPPEDVLSINTVEQLAQVDEVLRRREADEAATAGGA